MKEFELKYGCNPNQKLAKIWMEDGQDLPIEILNGRPGYINFLDAFNSWQLVKELKAATGFAAAASFKHVSPAGAAIGLPLDLAEKQFAFCEDIDGLNDSAIACAYARARSVDRLCSFGDFVALSDTCDETTARLLSREVSDGIIAPGYTKEALEILKAKRKGSYNVIQINKDFEPESLEHKQVFGITFEQQRNNFKIDNELLNNLVTENQQLSENARRDLIIALITLKYTQSNSVCFAYGGQAIGVGAGQQSRIHCTRLAGDKADTWFLRHHRKVVTLPFQAGIGRPERDNLIDAYINGAFYERRGNEPEILKDGQWQKYFTEKPEAFTLSEQAEYLRCIEGVSLASDAFFPFADNIERAAASGVRYVAQPGGSIRDDLVIDACNQHGMAMAFTGMRLFHH